MTWGPSSRRNRVGFVRGGEARSGRTARDPIGGGKGPKSDTGREKGRRTKELEAELAGEGSHPG